MRLLAILAGISLAGCGTPNQQAEQGRDRSIDEQMQQHGDYLATERAIDEQLNLPGGPDYAAAIRIAERSSRAPLQKDYDIGGLLLSACRDRVAYCTGAPTAARGVTLLTHVAMTPGEDAAIAAGDLALWYTRGAGPALPPDPSRAACWTAARDGKTKAATCAAAPAGSR